MRQTILTAALVAFASPLLAQAAQQAKDNDPTHKAAGGITAAGWIDRVDAKDARRGMSTSDVKFVTMGTGYHVTAGPAAIYYNPKDVAKGEYTVSATFVQTKAPMHPEAYGLFVGGSNLQDSTPQYVYFLTRGDGKYFVAHMAGADRHVIVNWTESDLTKKQDEAGKQSNQLAVRVTKDSVQFLANGKPVTAFAKADMHGFSADGQAGIRVNHNLDLHIADFQVKKGM
jgi:hypothetical protein